MIYFQYLNFINPFKICERNPKNLDISYKEKLVSKMPRVVGHPKTRRVSANATRISSQFKDVCRGNSPRAAANYVLHHTYPKHPYISWQYHDTGHERAMQIHIQSAQAAQ
jgi:hypothetical protein